jgi:hypothetical protein
MVKTKSSTTIAKIGEIWRGLTSIMSSANITALNRVKGDFSNTLKDMQRIADKGIKITYKIDPTTGGATPVEKATGGVLAGFGGGDTVPALLEAGEGIIRKEAVRHYGQGFINLVNSMQYRLSDLPNKVSGYLSKAVSVPVPMQSGGIAPSLANFGRIELAVGSSAFPVLIRQNVMEEFTEALEREKLLRNN